MIVRNLNGEGRVEEKKPVVEVVVPTTPVLDPDAIYSDDEDDLSYLELLARQ